MGDLVVVRAAGVCAVIASRDGAHLFGDVGTTSAFDRGRRVVDVKDHRLFLLSRTWLAENRTGARHLKK